VFVFKNSKQEMHVCSFNIETVCPSLYIISSCIGGVGKLLCVCFLIEVSVDLISCLRENTKIHSSGGRE
jgi:hypothetical protein